MQRRTIAKVTQRVSDRWARLKVSQSFVLGSSSLFCWHWMSWLSANPMARLRKSLFHFLMTRKYFPFSFLSVKYQFLSSGYADPRRVWKPRCWQVCTNLDSQTSVSKRINWGVHCRFLGHRHRNVYDYIYGRVGEMAVLNNHPRWC